MKRGGLVVVLRGMARIQGDLGANLSLPLPVHGGQLPRASVFLICRMGIIISTLRAVVMIICDDETANSTVSGINIQ